MKSLPRIQFGNPILRKTAQKIPVKNITTPEIQELITNMHHTLVQKKLGVGLAAPQVGKSLQLAIISIRPSEHRPTVKPFELVIINPVIAAKKGDQKELWEGCISSGAGKAALFAKTPRYPEIQLRYHDLHGKGRTRTLKGIQAQVVQHEVDHLNGILFVDRVKDTTTYATYSEYLRMIKDYLKVKRISL